MPTFEDFGSGQNADQLKAKLGLITNRIGRVDSKHHSRITEIKIKIAASRPVSKDDVEFINTLSLRMS